MEALATIAGAYALFCFGVPYILYKVLFENPDIFAKATYWVVSFGLLFGIPTAGTSCMLAAIFIFFSLDDILGEM